jgi:hypothetical protein
MDCVSVGVLGVILVPPRQCLPGLLMDPGRVPGGRRITSLTESQQTVLGGQERTAMAQSSAGGGYCVEPPEPAFSLTHQFVYELAL